MTHHVPGRRRWPVLVLGAGSAVVLVAGLVLALSSMRPDRTAHALSPLSPSSPTSSSIRPLSTPTSSPVVSVPSGRPPSAPLADRSSPPVRVRVPSIGIDSSLQPLGLLSDGTLQSPSQWQQAGWYDRGTVPGSVGPAVIAGHVDSVNGPAVFFRLRQIAAGAQILVQRRNGTTLTFVVDEIHEYPKDKFPSAAVYGPTADPQLRLITCTGDFDYSKRSYLDNLVVSAHLR